MRILSVPVIMLCFLSNYLYAGYESVHQDMADLMNKRLSVMADVACFKFVQGLPVEDVEREEQLMASILAEATALGIEEGLARGFIRAQIEAAKLLQHEVISDLQRKTKVSIRRKAGRGSVVITRNRKGLKCEADLATIRKELDGISKAMLNDLKQTEFNREQLKELLSSDYSSAVREQSVKF